MHIFSSNLQFFLKNSKKFYFVVNSFFEVTIVSYYFLFLAKTTKPVRRKDIDINKKHKI